MNRLIAIGAMIASFPLAVAHAEERVIAILSPPQPPELEALQALAEATLSSEPDIAVVDRQNLRQVLKEQNLQLSGLADPRTAVRVGKLVGARLLVFIEPTLQTQGQAVAGGCVIYDVISGVRLIDRSLAGKDLEARNAEDSVPGSKSRSMRISAG